MTTMVTLHPECCTGAICSCCKEHKDNLLKCARCKRAWYCSKEHQKQHYAEHKQTCKVAAPFVDALIDSIQECSPESYAAIQKLIVGASIYAQRHGPQGFMQNNLFSYLCNTVFCRVCFKIREQLPNNPLVCCPKCLWGWCCKEHFQEFQPQHAPFCDEYATMRRLGVLMREQASLGLVPGNQLPYPMAKITQLQQAQVLQDWQKYRRLRVPSVSNEDTWKCMTADMTIPLTSVWAAKQLYSKQQLASMQEFNLHLVGAAHFEFDHVVTNTAIEEVLHLLPPVKVLRVVLVGPEFKVITRGPKVFSHFNKEVCPPCSRIGGIKRIITIYRGAYEEYAASTEWNEPTLAMACNSGVGCEDEASWARALKVLLDKKVPCCFTSMNPEELQLDSQALRKAGAHILHTGRNTFGSLVPFRDIEAQPDEFYYQNGWLILFKGKGETGTNSS